MTTKLRTSTSVTVMFAPHDDLQERRSGTVTELTEDGVFIASNTVWPPKTVLALLLTIPGERLPVQLSGDVAWARTRDVAGMFVTFREPADHPTRARLRPPSAPLLRAGVKAQD